MLNLLQNEGNMLENKKSYLEIQSHIKGLGLDETGHAVEGSDGMIGQQKIRQAAGVAVKLLKQKTDLRRYVLISGPVGSGKSTISKAIIHEMECDCNVILLKDELENPQRCQLEILTQALRKAIEIRIVQENFIIFGEVVEINYDKPAPGVQSSVGSIVMQTKNMSAIYGLDVAMVERLKRKAIEKGDVITINFVCAEIVCVGHTDPNKNNYMECPDGELAFVEPLFHRVNLNEMDIYNTFYDQAIESAEQLANIEIKDEIREVVNLKVQKWITEGKAEILWGAVLIDNVKCLNAECINYLQSAQLDWLPFVILNAMYDELEDLEFSKKFLKSVIKITTSSHSDLEIDKILTLRQLKHKIAIAEKNYHVLKLIAKLSLSFACRILNMMNRICMKIVIFPELQIIFTKKNFIIVTKNFYSDLLLHNIPLTWDVEITFRERKIFLTFEFTEAE